MNFYKHETGEDFLSRIKKKHWSSRNRFVIPAILKFKTSVHHIMILKKLKARQRVGEEICNTYIQQKTLIQTI